MTKAIMATKTITYSVADGVPEILIFFARRALDYNGNDTMLI